MEKKVVLNKLITSPSSIFSKEDVIKLIDSIDIEEIQFTVSEFDWTKLNLSELFMEETVEQKPYLVSLYDYLGKAAGKTLGGEVFLTARTLKETVEERAISNSKYEGNVHLYRREFLDEYFGNKIYEGEQK